MIVPVLSLHNTVAAHSVSTAAIFLVSTFFLDILHAPIARNTVNTIGNSSGRIPIASVNQESSPCIQSLLMNPYASTIVIHSITAMINAPMTIFLTCFWSVVFSVVISPSALPIRHISVFVPIEMTLTTHCPCTIIVQEKTNG